MKNQNSPNLVEGSNAEERRRLARFAVSNEQFKLTRTGKVFGVADLSLHGMALRILDPADLILFSVGSSVEGILNLGGRKVALNGRVRRVVPQSVGCEFETISREAAQQLAQFLDPLRLGSELRLMPGADASAAWFHGPSGADLIVSRTQGAMTEYSFVVMGTFVRWRSGEGLSTGRVEESGEPSEQLGLLRIQTMSWIPDAAPDLKKLEVAKTVLLSSNLPKELKTELDHTWIAISP